MVGYNMTMTWRRFCRTNTLNISVTWPHIACGRYRHASCLLATLPPIPHRTRPRRALPRAAPSYRTAYIYLNASLPTSLACTTYHPCLLTRSPACFACFLTFLPLHRRLFSLPSPPPSAIVASLSARHLLSPASLFSLLPARASRILGTWVRDKRAAVPG